MAPKLPEEPLPNRKRKSNLSTEVVEREPIVQTDTSKNNSGVNGNSPLTTREVENNKRKNRILEFSFRALLFMGIGMIVIVIVDIIVNALKLQSEMLKEVFNVIKYSTTTILGYLFAKENG